MESRMFNTMGHKSRDMMSRAMLFELPKAKLNHYRLKPVVV